uniref:Uncharacterized protein n=1 Tax=Ciona intestinalis TaxID=7719 RepID=F6PWZ1_CIOIN
SSWSSNDAYCELVTCASPVAPENGSMRCTRNSDYQSKCTFECDRGFELNGAKRSVCERSGEWSIPFPSCLRIVCRNRLLLEHGSVTCSKSENFGSKCDFSCQTGYELLGSSHATCGQRGSWDFSRESDLPLCERNLYSVVTCPELEAHSNGDIECTAESNFRSRCTLTCHLGYEVKGTNLITCGAAGRWKGKLGHCSRITCPILEQPLHGSVTCTQSNEYDSRCTFACDEGYELIGSVARTCQMNKRWSGEIVTCRQITCTELLPPTHGTISCSQRNTFRSTCTFFCEIGYTMHGTSSRTCQSDGSWTGKHVSCGIVTCEAVPAPQHGSKRCTDGENFDSSCRFTCDIGYQLVGSISRTCLESGEWNGISTSCVMITCSEMDNPAHGLVECTSNNNYQSICTISCNAGYNLVGTNTRTCQATHTWSGIEATCVMVTCPALATPSHGSVECDESNVFNSSCKFKCKIGYELVGTNFRSCGGEGIWSGREVTCVLIVCDLLSVPDHGRMTCSNQANYHSRCSFTCDIGYEIVGSSSRTCLESSDWSGVTTSCSVISCSALPAPENGRLVCSNVNSFESSCEVTCDIGYTMHGTSSRTCQSDGSWTGKHVSCAIVTCEAVPTPQDGNKRCTDGENFDSSCRFTCDIGYRLVGSISRTCLESGEWNGISTSCVIITCAKMDIPAHGSVECTSNNNYQSICTFACNNGYELIGSEVRTCQATRSWSGIAVTCAMVTCPALTSPSHGSIKCDNQHHFNSSCNFNCREGYTLVGSQTRNCQANRAWTGNTTSCSLITCPAIKEPDHGRKKCTDGDNYSSDCQFICDIGYELVGTNFRSCGGEGVWSGREVTCVLIVCDLLSVPDHGRMTCSNQANYHSRCSFTCDIGYEIVGSSSRTCLESSDWSGVTTSCSVVTCPVLPSPNHGRKSCSEENRYLSECQYVCDVGFDRHGSENRVCQEDGTWSGSPVGCGIITCDTLLVPLHGKKRCADGDNFESTCRFSCEIGYELTGSQSRTCMELGEWSGIATMCSLITCDELPKPEHGSVRCTKHDGYDSRCTLSCQEGYVLFGSSTRTCSVDGTWSGKVTTCERITCPYIPFPSHGRKVCTDKNHFSSNCQFVCEVGFNIIGSTARVCQSDGLWSGTAASCEIVTCNALDVPEYGRMRCADGNNFESTCHFTCDIGYELIGTSSRTCMESSAWNGEATSCQSVTCPSLPSPSHGRKKCTDGNNFESACRFICDVGHDVVGTRVRTCQVDGTWSGQTVTCRIVTCSTLEVPQYGKKRCEDGENFESRCRFSCDIGYTLRGSKARVCQEDGTWTGMSASCRMVRCGKTKRIRYGTVNCSAADHYNSVCRYECKTGFDLIGNPTRVCQDDRQWSAAVPTCQRSRCGLLDTPVHGSMRCTNEDFFSSQCEFECDQSYRLIGSPLRICKPDRSWSARQPTCQPRDCLPLNAPEHGTIACNKQYYYDSECRFTCDIGYELLGSVSRRCTASGSQLSVLGWTGTQTSCQGITCGELPGIDNGSIRCVGGNGFRASCVYVCNNGYNLVGSDSRKCTANGEWTNIAPVCTLTTCVPLRAPRNGAMDCDESINECGTTCTFTCRKGYTLSGDARRTCGKDMRWTGVAAECLRATCPPLGVSLSLTYTCTNGSNVGSNCTFQCDEDATLLGSTYRVCLNDGTWSRSNPVCRACKTAVTDVIFIVDGSWSVGEINFRKAKDFLKALVEPFEVGWDNSRFAVVQYSDDPRTEFLMNEHFTVTDVLNAIDAIPYKGGNTNTGKALAFSLYTALSPANGARPYVNKVALVLTDGRSQDEVGNPARELRQAGVKVLTVGVGDADKNELKSI